MRTLLGGLSVAIYILLPVIGLLILEIVIKHGVCDGIRLAKYKEEKEKYDAQKKAKKAEEKKEEKK